MSTSYRPLTPINVKDLRAALPIDEIEIGKIDDQSDAFALSDGAHYLWVYPDADGNVSFERWGSNNVDFIIDNLEREFNVVIVDEHDPRYFEGQPNDEEDSE